MTRVGGWVSSDGFTVDLDALGAAGARAGRLADELTASPATFRGVEVFGHRRLSEAVTEFAERERRERARLAGVAESLRHRLVETVRTYRRADEDGAGRFGGIA
ncbi:type VII secretion target [Actinophytocola gossypii]|uniref:ESX-1 secretion-associated protein n=1 Tax=Actinophytocola gossypii TaxID=2812003 RepID=A0ABT2J454_9PSEU|nr:type VII secretion target [Actinophytocola gossypii]MCT2582645.1 hypothetical protein [Actinophytocola gossypii]